MFKVGGRVFDNRYGYGDGVVVKLEGELLFVNFKYAYNVSYTLDGRWLSQLPVTLFKK